MLDKRSELQTIVLSQYTTVEQKQSAQVALNALDSAPAATPAPTPAARAKHYMDWIPEGSAESRADTINMLAQLRAELAAGISSPKPADGY